MIFIAQAQSETWFDDEAMPHRTQVNSDFIRDLNSDVDRLNLLNFTSLWTPFDLIILPPSSSQLGIGTEMQIPALTHPMMVSDRRTFKAISDTLSHPVRSPT